MLELQQATLLYLHAAQLCHKLGKSLKLPERSFY